MADSIYHSIQSITARAVPLWDRMAVDLNGGRSQPGKISKRINRWITLLGSEQLLHRRLLCTEVSAVSLDSLLGDDPVVVHPEQWHTTLRQILDYYEQDHTILALKTGKVADPSYPLPFEEAFMPLIFYYREQLEERGSSLTGLLTEEANIYLEQQLLSHLSFICGLSLGKLFYEFRLACAPAAAFEHLWTRQPTSNLIYQQFIDGLFNGGFINYLEQYPVMARLICQSTKQFISSVLQFLERFHNDFSELKTAFGWRQETTKRSVSRLRLHVSDRHHGGLTVMECTLTSGDVIIYKPRNVDPEIAYYRFLARMNELLPRINNKIITIVGKEHHGWVERVEPASCVSATDVEQFYQRTGVLLAVAHVLALTDVHFENLIACGAWPVIVDLETLLDEVLVTESDNGLPHPDSVLRTGMLPRWQHTAEGKPFDMSAIGADLEQDAGIQRSTWMFINTDQMYVTKDTRTLMQLHHRPCLNDKYPSPPTYLGFIVQGFAEAYSCLMQHRALLCRDQSLMSFFNGLELRTIVRDTNTYAGLQFHLLHPEFLENGIDRSIELEWLARPLMGTKKPNLNRMRVYDVERSAMELMDVPHFHSAMGWNEVEGDDEDLHFLKRVRDSNLLKKRLDTLCDDDLQLQTSIVKGALVERFGEMFVAG